MKAFHRNAEIMFQFHNGSIKSQAELTLRTELNTFQFHNGSIKSMAQNRSRLPNFCFNSTMVRLKVSNNEWQGEHYSGFNSTMVRLKETDKQQGMPIMRCFNSTMVRLKANMEITTMIRMIKFQFHNGSIKR